MKIHPAPHIAALAPYALADSRVPSGKRPILLAQNEHCLPPSPEAIEAARAELSRGNLYPDPDWADLRRAIADIHDLDAASILCSAGSMEMIQGIALAFLGPGARALTTEYGYLFFRTAARIAGAEVDLAREQSFTADADALIEAARPETRVAFLANPGNPSGTVIGRAEMLRLRDGLRDDILLVIDEAYGELNTDGDGPVFDLIARGNTVVLRTFSKAHGLAGMRCGWGVFPPEVAGVVRRVMLPNNVSAATQAAAAAAMRDQAWMKAGCETVADRRDRFAAGMRQLGLMVPPSRTNFILIGFGSEERCREADRRLRAEGIVLRGMGGYGLGACLRATIGSEEDMDGVRDVLAHWLAGA